MPPSSLTLCHSRRPKAGSNSIHWPERIQKCCLISVFLFTALTSIAPGGELEDRLTKICETQKVPGIIAASVGPDGLIESGSAGIRKRGENSSVSTDDQFAIGSNSKSFTSTLAAVLVERGVIDWSTTIGQTWPDQSFDPGFQNVTLKQLLAHTGGLQGDLSNGPEWISFFAERSSPQKERARMCESLLSKAPQGTVGNHSYSNLGYVVAAAMLETRGRQPFEQLMRQNVFKPLGMSNTEFYSAKKINGTSGPLLWGHNGSGSAVKPGAIGSENPSVYAGCGTIRTTIGDWAKYVAWHLNEKAVPVLQLDDTMRKLHHDGVNRGIPGQAYGCGWIQFQSKFGHTLQHAGSNTNQFSLVWVMPEAKRATIVMTNTHEPQAFSACDAATAVLMSRPSFQ